MQQFIKHLNAFFEHKPIDFVTLGNCLQQFNFDRLEFEHLLEAQEARTSYTRIQIQANPIDVVLLKWPKGAESGIHWHQGFFGYVVCLEGRMQDVHYQYQENSLSTEKELYAFPRSMMKEADGIIHKICNPSEEEELVTLHIYYPPISTFEGMKIFNLEKGAVGTLSAVASGANWSEREGHFSFIQSNAFTYRPFEKSHKMVHVSPKPDEETIKKLINEYYQEQAKVYDAFDLNHATRCAYTETINRLIGEDLAKHSSIEQFLSIATGTGRRPIEIEQIASRKIDFTGVEMNAAMAHEASQKGILTINECWLDVELTPASFDAASFLYAFGHISTHERRVRSLKKIAKMLRKGGRVYIDLFNMHDCTEWGPSALKAFETNNLGSSGYDKGDVFYKKTGGNSIAFLHYFSENEVKDLFNEAGFSIEKIQYIGYVQASGKLVATKEEGFFFITGVKA